MEVPISTPTRPRPLVRVGSIWLAPEDLVSVFDIAQMLDVDRSTVHRWARTLSNFPEPLGETASGRVWRRSDVEDWAEHHRPRRGRPQKET
jgi:predicted DNA-binding transcriptional regulator AlpA